MPSHWTYAEFDANADLAQGDIVEPADELRAVLQQVHPHFLLPKYIAFMVLSQSCDLVRRPGHRQQPIFLCVIREFDAVAKQLVQLFCGSDIPGIFRNDSRVEGRRFIERVINQNEQAIGLFYLHTDADAGIARPSVAMLRIGICLRAEHYDKLVAARRGRLRSEFQAKLGWLTGNLYSRIGTEDWSESEDRRKQQRKMIDEILDGLPDTVWWTEAAIGKAKSEGFSAVGKSATEIGEALKAFEPKPLDQQLLDSIARVASNSSLGIAPEAIDKLVKRIPNDATIAPILRKLRTK